MRPNNTSQYLVHQARLPDASNTVSSDDGGSVRPVTTAVISGAGEWRDSGDGQSISTRSVQMATVAETFGLEASRTRLANLSAHIERLLGDQWTDDQITEYRNQIQQINAGLKDLEQSELKSSEQYRKVKKQFEELQVKDYHHRLDELEGKLERGNIESKDIQSIEREITQLSKRFDELAFAGDEERSQLLEHHEALSNQLDEVKRYFSIHNEIKSLETDLKDFKLRELTGPDQIINFFDHIEDSLSKISTLIDSLPTRSQRTKLLEKKCQLRDSLNTSKKAVKQQKLESIEQIIKTQENNSEQGAVLNEDMLEQAESQLNDLKKLMNSLKMEEQESGKLKDLKVRLAKLTLTNNEQTAISQARSSNTAPAGDIIENLELAEALITTSENHPDEFSEKRASEAKRYLDEVKARCEKLRDRHQRSELLDRCRSMSARLQKIEEKKGEIVGKKVEELLNRANNAIRVFSSPVRVEEVKKVEALIEQARLKIKSELSDSNYETVRNGLLAKRKELEEKLQPYKDNISDNQQTTAANSNVKNTKDPLKKKFNKYWKEYTRDSKFLEEQVLECSKSDSRNDRIVKIDKLMDFYNNSLVEAEKLHIELFDMPAYKNECLILNHNIKHMREQKSTMERLKREPIGCIQS